MKTAKNIEELPLTKNKPDTLQALFGTTEITPMWVADMDFEIAKPIQEALINRIRGSSLGYEYKPASFFAAQHKWYKDHYQVELKAQDIFYSPTISTAIALLIEISSKKSDGVIIQPPVFMEFKDTIRKTRRKIIKNPLKFTNSHYSFDFEDLEEKAKQEKNKILIVCNPHNPVGRVWSEQELKRIVDICKRNDLLLISDEAHKDIILFDNKFNSALKYQNEYDKIAVCTSEAKTFNLCGITDASVIINNESIRKTLKTSFGKYNLGRTNALTRVALEAAYNDASDWLVELIQTIEANVLAIESELEKSKSKIKLIKPEGTYQVWLDFRDVFDDSKKMFSEVIKNSGVGMNAGHWFGREGALFMRMNIASPHDKVVDAIKKLIAAV